MATSIVLINNQFHGIYLSDASRPQYGGDSPERICFRSVPNCRRSGHSYIIGTIVLTALAEIIRYYCKYDTLKGVRLSFIPFAFSFFAYTAHWWFDTEGSLSAAVEEMPAGYDQLMIPVINIIPALLVVLVLTIPVSMLAMRLAERILNKQTEGLDDEAD